MWSELKTAGDLRAVGRGAEYEAFPHNDEKKRFFYDRYMKGELIDAPWVKKADFEKAASSPSCLRRWPPSPKPSPTFCSSWRTTCGTSVGRSQRRS
ncbi:MAG: hypothetical protein EBU04_07980 [Verrucomicrobia bacterium]|nr:hypothetical protein [Verrucomicrobiota bacterium]